jgi:flagellar hook-associated protein 3 FlgL
MLASANSAIASTGTSTTGSYMRDLLRALATIGSMTSSQAGTQNFTALVQDTQTSLNGVVSAMTSDAGVLGNRQTELTTQQANMAQTVTVLKTQISNVQDVDMAATLSKLATTQTQLQASYHLINSANSMSLVNFLPAG